MSQDKPVLSREWLEAERRYWQDEADNSPLPHGFLLRVALCDLALSVLDRQGKWVPYPWPSDEQYKAMRAEMDKERSREHNLLYAYKAAVETAPHNDHEPPQEKP